MNLGISPFRLSTPGLPQRFRGNAGPTTTEPATPEAPPKPEPARPEPEPEPDRLPFTPPPKEDPNPLPECDPGKTFRTC